MSINSSLNKFSVYSEGFKGLADGWLDLKQCNFIIGENSSGKSSLIQLLELLDSREHLLFFDILDAVPGLESAFDICSRLSKAKHVTIGFFLETKGSLDLKGRLCKYKLIKGHLTLVEMSFVHNDKCFHLKKVGAGFRSRLEGLEFDEADSHLEKAQAFSKSSLASKGYKRVELEDNTSAFSFTEWMEAIRKVVSTFEGCRLSNFMTRSAPLRTLHYGPIRAKARRLYHGDKTEFSPSGDHIAYVLKDNLSENGNLQASLKKFGEESGLFDEIIISKVRTKVPDQPFALQVKKGAEHYYVDELGYGVGQILPVVTDIYLAGGFNSFLIEQPELHLHPKAQAALGEVFFSAAESGGMLVIETHSDFIIDRFRISAVGADNMPSSQIIFFDKGEDGKNCCHCMEIKPDGSITHVPEAYRQFFVNEALDKFENLQ